MSEDITIDVATNSIFDKLQDFFDSVDNTVELSSGFGIQWSVTGIGFGSFHFSIQEDGTVQIDNETMSKEFIKKVVCQMVDEAVLDS